MTKAKLVGTEKQIKWAMDIREKMITEFNDDFDNDPEMLPSEDWDMTDQDVKDLFFKMIATVTFSDTYIKNKTGYESMLEKYKKHNLR